MCRWALGLIHRYPDYQPPSPPGKAAQMSKDQGWGRRNSHVLAYQFQSDSSQDDQSCGSPRTLVEVVVVVDKILKVNAREFSSYLPILYRALPLSNFVNVFKSPLPFVDKPGHILHSM